MKIVTPLFVLITFVLLATSACNKKDCNKTGIKEDCFCTQEYDPVCGCDGETYGNDCIAGCNGITEYRKGECK